MMIFAVLHLALACSVDGFVKPLTYHSRLSISRLFTNHFDDFDFVIGDQGSAPNDLLQERMRQVQQEDVRKDKQIAEKLEEWKLESTRLFSRQGT